MRLVEFLILILEAHGQTLTRLAAILGEDVLLEMLESAGEGDEATGKIPSTELELPELDPPQGGSGVPYAELEGSVREMKLPAVLEFHLWAYPHYRAFIESSLNLNARIRGSGSDQGIQLVDAAIAEAREWVRKLPLPPQISQQAERAAEIPWLRFRTLALKRIGKRPLGPVY
jgi:hypothetical protein